jgi:hypothetical protein
MKTHYQPPLTGLRNPMQEIWNKLRSEESQYLYYFSMEFPDTLDLSFLTQDMVTCTIGFSSVEYTPLRYGLLLIPDHEWIGLSELSVCFDDDIRIDLYLGNGISNDGVGRMSLYSSIHCNLILPRWMVMDIKMKKRERLLYKYSHDYL